MSEFFAPDSDLLSVFDAPEGVMVTLEADVTHLCPVNDNRDHGHATISYETAARGQTIEVSSVNAYLSAYAGESVSHEELATRIKADFEYHVGRTFVTLVFKGEYGTEIRVEV